MAPSSCPDARTPSSAAVRDVSAQTLLALAVNLIHLGSKSIMFDEATSVVYARLSSAAFLDVILDRDPNQSLYYILLRLWLRMFGESEAAVRVPSALFGALAVGALYLLGRHLFGRAAGLTAGLLLALDAFMVQYAQIARAYSLLVLLTTLSSLFLVRELERPSRGNRIAYVATIALAVYTHYFAVFLLTVHLLAVVASRRKAALSRPWPTMAATVVIACLPTAVFAYRIGPSNRISWIQPPSPAAIGHVLIDFAGGSSLVLCVLLGAGCHGAVLGWRQRRAGPYCFTAACLFVPVALSFLASLVQPMFLANYLIFCVPALVLFGAAGIMSLRPPMMAYALVICLACISATKLRAFYANERPQNWRAATRHVLDNMQPGDGVVYFPDSAHKPIGYYARQRGTAEPPDLAERPLADRKRIWFVIRTSDVVQKHDLFRKRQSSVRERSRLADRREFGSVAIELYVR